MISWAAIIVASLSWLFAFHQHVPENPTRQWICITIALLMGVIAEARSPRQLHVPLRFVLLLLPLAIAYLISRPSYDSAPAYHPALLVMALGVVLQVITSARLGVIRPLADASLWLGTLLLAQSPIYFFCSAFAARAPDVPMVSEVLYGLLKWIGADVSFSDGTLFLRLLRDVHAFRVTWDQLALFPAVLIGVGGALTMAWDRSDRSWPIRMTLLTLTVIGFLMIRLFVLILVFATLMLFIEYKSDTVHVEVFWLPAVTALSFLPLVVLLNRWLPLNAFLERTGPSTAELARVEVRLQTGVHGATPELTTADQPQPARPPRPWAARGLVVAASTACLGLTFSLCFHDPGVRRAGRVLLDESHSQWERSDTTYDTNWYGHESGYNFYCIVQYLKHFVELDINHEGLLTPQKLAQYDVLILKTPTTPYTPEELDAIEGFVRNGGGMLAIGEHTNVFGSSTCLNPVTRRFGIFFNYDCLFDIERKWEQVYFPPRWGGHPIVKHVPLFRFAVSSSIAVDSWKTRPVIRSGGLWSLMIDYSSANFYAQIKDATDARFGSFDQMVSTTAGHGRVAAFGDSTVYSNFEAFYPGKPQLLVGAIDWLNRTNRWDWLNSAGLFGFAAAALLTAILWVCRGVELPLAAIMMSTATSAVWLTLATCSLLADRAHPSPAPLRPVPVINFELGHSKAELPVFAFTKNHANSFEIFYQWTLRPGFFPRISFNFEQALRGSEPIILLKPEGEFPATIIEQVRSFIQRGGSLLVLDSPGRPDSSANELLAPFGLELHTERCRGAFAVEPASGVRLCQMVSGAAVEGGTALLSTDQGEPVLSYITLGTGQLIAGGLAERFCDSNMGGSSRVVPDDRLRAVYELAFALQRGLQDRNIARHVGALTGSDAERP